MTKTVAIWNKYFSLSVFLLAISKVLTEAMDHIQMQIFPGASLHALPFRQCLKFNKEWRMYALCVVKLALISMLPQLHLMTENRKKEKISPSHSIRSALMRKTSVHVCMRSVLCICGTCVDTMQTSEGSVCCGILCEIAEGCRQSALLSRLPLQLSAAHLAQICPLKGNWLRVRLTRQNQNRLGSQAE